jgi:hypothetical protein
MKTLNTIPTSTTEPAASIGDGVSRFCYRKLSRPIKPRRKGIGPELYGDIFVARRHRHQISLIKIYDRGSLLERKN